MNDAPMLHSSLQSKFTSRSMGVKLLIVCVLALVMTIPALFVDDLVDDRTHRASDVVKEISSHVGGQQTFLGPTLAIPYDIPAAVSIQCEARHLSRVSCPGIGDSKNQGGRKTPLTLQGSCLSGRSQL